MPMEFVFIIGLAVLLFLCLKVRANAFISLLATALVMGLLSGMTGADTIGAITGGFSGTVKSIGIIIIFGIMLGNYLDAAKGTNRMALDAVRLVGQKRAGLAMAITGYIVSIPVFSDAAFVILTPLVKAIHKKTRIPLAILAVSLSAGLLATHVYVPPTPGPLAAAGLLGIDIGQAIMYGAFAAVFMTLFGWGFAEIYFRNKPSSFYSFQESGKKEEEGLDIEDETDLPGTMASLLPLVVPILLILGKTTCDMLCPEGVPPVNHAHLFCQIGQINHVLQRRISAAHDADFHSPEKCAVACGAIGNAVAGILLFPCDSQLPGACAQRQDHGFGLIFSLG